MEYANKSLGRIRSSDAGVAMVQQRQQIAAEPEQRLALLRDQTRLLLLTLRLHVRLAPLCLDVVVESM